jgi:hypothetical protein
MKHLTSDDIDVCNCVITVLNCVEYSRVLAISLFCLSAARAKKRTYQQGGA